MVAPGIVARCLIAVVPDGIADWAARSGPAAVLAAVRTRAERGQRTESGTLTGLGLSPEQRRELGLLLGTRWEVSGLPVNLKALADCLAEHELSVRGLIESLHGGPIEENRAVAARAATVQVLSPPAGDASTPASSTARRHGR